MLIANTVTQVLTLEVFGKRMVVAVRGGKGVPFNYLVRAEINTLTVRGGKVKSAKAK